MRSGREDPAGSEVATSIATTCAMPEEGPYAEETAMQAITGLPAHWEPRSRLPRGGMAEILIAWDRNLERELVIKIARRSLRDSQRLRRHFEVERRLTAGLDHAGVVPVIDSGELDDGRQWFAMRRIRGLTLEELVHWVMDGIAPREPPPPGPWDLHRLVEVFHRICDIVGDAHGRGIVHRDLKPRNVMVDLRADVFVLDWGIALVTGEPGADEDGLDRGQVVGTPAYMAPEQARGEIEQQGPRSDVYALGGILYFLLCGRAPHPQGIQDVLAGPAPPVAELAARRGRFVPPELARLCAEAMARDPSDRPANGLRLALLVQEWLEADRRRTQARALVDGALQLEGRAQTLAREARRLREDAEALLAPLRPFDPEEVKRPAWDLQEAAEAVERDLERTWAEHEHRLRAALVIDPWLEEARDLLADRYLQALLTAEARGDAPAAARAEFLLGEYARGQRRAWLRPEGRITLRTDPPARVRVERFERRYGRLFPQARPDLDFHTPVEELPLPAGSYRLWLEAPGLPPVVYPVLIGRGAHWCPRPPGEAEPAALPLAPAGGLGREDCYVPPGPFQCGGDPDAPDSIPGRELWVDGFIIRRFPVTCGEYLDFLNDLVQRGEEAEARRWEPRPVGARLAESGPIVRDATGRYVLGAWRDGIQWQADWPVALVSWEAAMAFAAWEAERTGQPWRLPDELEWEKAARGVDGRRYPWGDRLDPTWTCMLSSHAGQPHRVPVHACPVDESPYGVRGLGGNVRDWCLNAFSKRGPPAEIHRVVPGAAGEDSTYRMVRGGSFSSAPGLCLSAARFVFSPSEGSTVVGFRLSRSSP